MLYRHLDELRRHPGLYLSEPRLKALEEHLGGFLAAMRLGGVPAVEDPPFRQFYDFVARSLGFYESTSGWYNMIMSQESTEEAAFHVFFELLDRFRGRTRQPLMTVDVDTAAAQRWRELRRRMYKRANGETEDVPAPVPDRLRVVRYVPDLGVYLEGEYKGGWRSERWFDTLEQCLNSCAKLYQIPTSTWTAHAEHVTRWTREYSVREIESGEPDRVIEGFHLLAYNDTDAAFVEEMAVLTLAAVSQARSLPILRALQQTWHLHDGWSSKPLIGTVERLACSENAAIRRLSEDILRRIECS